MLSRVSSDVRLAVRALRRAPGYSAAVAVTLALSIGAATAILMVVDAALLRPLPYPDADRMAILTVPGGGEQAGQVFLYVRQHAANVEVIAAQGGSSGWSLTTGDATTGMASQWVAGMRISEGFFEAHGLEPLRGRGFSDAEDQPGGPDAVIISDGLWQRLFGGRDVLGATVQLGGVPHTIVGIAPRGFRSVPPADAWTPLRTNLRDQGQNYRVIARLPAGTSAEQAMAGLDAIRPGLHREFPRMNPQRIAALSWLPYRDYLGSSYRSMLSILLGAAGVLLLIACVNIAGLQLARTVVQRRDAATRAALGASRARLVGPVLAESLVLAAAGGLLGLAIAAGVARGLPFLLSDAIAITLLSGETLRVDWRAWLAASALAISSAVIFGIGPAFAATRVNVRASLNEGSRGTMGRGTVWLRRTFVTAEIAMAVILLVGAGLLARTFVNLTSVNLGFDSTGVLVARMSLQSGAPAVSANVARMYEQTLERIRQTPGVSAAAASNNAPIERGLNIAIAPPPGSLVAQTRAVDYRYVTADYFRTLRLPLMTGRTFDDRDRAGSEPVAIVNEAFARAYFGSLDVVGRPAHAAIPPMAAPTIVGVAADAKAASGSGWTGGLTALGTAAAPTIFVPVGQAAPALLESAHRFFPVTWLIRAATADAATADAVERTLRAAHPQQAVVRVESMDAVVGRDLAIPRFLTSLIGTFSAVAVLLAAVGLYGLVAYSVTHRTREVGIRMALGETARGIFGTFVREGFLLGCVGATIGIGGALSLTSVLSSLLFGVTPLDDVTFIAVASFLILVATAASAVPAVRAARIDPVRTLRAE